MVCVFMDDPPDKPESLRQGGLATQPPHDVDASERFQRGSPAPRRSPHSLGPVTAAIRALRAAPLVDVRWPRASLRRDRPRLVGSWSPVRRPGLPLMFSPAADDARGPDFGQSRTAMLGASRRPRVNCFDALQSRNTPEANRRRRRDGQRAAADTPEGPGLPFGKAIPSCPCLGLPASHPTGDRRGAESSPKMRK